MKPQRVIVTPHAVDRLIERDSSVQTRDAIAHIFFQVQEAFRCQRTSKRIPRWAVAEARARTRTKSPADTVRYAWNETLSACWVLVWSDAVGDGHRSWIVVTTLGASEAAAA